MPGGTPIYKCQRFRGSNLFSPLKGTNSKATLAIEQFSIECRKTKTKVITLTNHISRNNPMNQSELEANTCSRRQARKNACRQVTIGFGFTSAWWRKWREIL